MTLNEVLKGLSNRKQLYIKYKFNLWWMDKERPLTEEQFLHMCDLKSMATFKRWERTPEYKHVVSCVLAAKQANDLIQIYEALKAKIDKDPNPKDIDMMLKLMKEINLHNKEAEKFFNHIDDEEDDLDI
ncbi:hypothetical protein [Paenibacillus vini]|uniref:Homeodomain phBC6A51-type domain-containing protein n=1 Tax=Paenibacillus vini TaxID=1476024 RepID=A0ABQ4M759_9BACL|nr:hypothetical protein [Paenibacillus vini]GIP51825.1 hypothetical protein J42TS3_08600 [Paenibacillus vini]